MLLPTFTTPIRPLVFAVGSLLASLLVMQNGNAQTNTNPVATSSEYALPEATLPDITITATRTPTKTSNTIAQTLVINETDLQRYRGQSVLDVIRGQTGFNIKQSGGDGTQSNFYLRGMDSKQILVLIDGIRYASLSTGGAALNLLPADQIERIEVLQGASGASLYGSDAMGGVIQVFTKGQNVAYSNVAVTLGAGTQNSTKAQITGQYRHQDTSLSLSAGQDKTDGIDATLPSAAFDIHRPDKDGFTSDNYSLVAKHKINDMLDVGVTGLYADSTSHFDNGVAINDAYTEQKNGAFSTFANLSQDKFTANLKYGQSFDKATTFDGADWETGRLADTFNTKQQQTNVQLSYQLPVGQAIGGVEWLKQTLNSSTEYSQKDRTIKSGFIGYQLNQADTKRRGYNFQAHVRHDSNSDYGDKTTFNVGTAYHLTPATRVGASYATGFRAPTFNDAYFKSSYFSGNPNLKPETSKNSEIFIENQHTFAPLSAKQKTRLTAYHSKLTDGIVITDNYSTMENLDSATIKGLNLSSDWQRNPLLFGLNYDYQDSENGGKKNKGKQLTYRATHKGLAYIGYQRPKFDIRAEMEYSGKRFSNASNTKSLGDYTLLNLSGNYYINPNLSLNTRLNNVTDTDYQTAEGYRQKGINAFVSATYQWF